jgi:tRNA pseudouridine13 synthase
MVSDDLRMVDQVSHHPARRYLSVDLEGIGGAIKKRVEDFRVEELPLYPPMGEGEHTFFEIQKTGLSTFEALRIVTQALGVSQNSIGYAGLKDAQAITCQVFSVHKVPPEAVMALDLADIRVMWAERHRNKLKIGHLRGNRFTIRVRGVDESALPASRAILDVLVRRGVPNYYGAQRFGRRGDSALLGRAVVRRDATGFIKMWIGGRHPSEGELVQQARSRFDAGQWQAAMSLFPNSMADERRALQALLQSQGDYRRAYAAVPKRLKIFMLSAYQAELFNYVLDARLQTLDQVWVGDVAVRHPARSVFRVEDEAAEQPRAERFEISPTGPMYGYKMMQAEARQGDLEAAILAAEGLTLGDFRVGQGIQAQGTRRALRFQIHEPELWYEDGLMLRFWLPRGCYATTVVGEIMKVPLTDDPDQDVSDATEL